MYFFVVIALTCVLPIASLLMEVFWQHSTMPPLIVLGKWMAFYAVGVRLFIAGLRQAVHPRFTLHAP